MKTVLGSVSAPEARSFTAIGVDGCRAGWFFVALEPSGQTRCGVVEKLDGLVSKADKSDRIFVDIPIGLPDKPETGGRECDKLARKVLGPPRQSSVFSAPARVVLEANDFEDAKDLSLKASGGKISISRQTFAILPKIREVDTLLRGNRKARRLVREVHPEVCFWALAGRKPIMVNKKKRAGFQERVAVLKSVRHSAEQEVTEILDHLRRQGKSRKQVACDDVLDAMVAAITATAETARLQTLPSHLEKDAFGLPMEMVYAFAP